MFRGVSYRPLSTDQDAQSPTVEKRSGSKQRRHCLAAAVAVALTLAFGVSALLFFAPNQKATDIPVENLKHQQFTYRTMFEPRFDYRSLDASTDALWDDDHLLTPNGGYLVREIDGEEFYFGVTMFHQLHCLQALRTALQVLTAQVNGTGSGIFPHSHWPHGSHYLHCLDYLRQTILCSADSTVEAPGHFPEIEHPVVSGYSVGRECVDHNVLYEMSREAGVIE